MFVLPCPSRADIYLDHVAWYLGERVLWQFGIDPPSHRQKIVLTSKKEEIEDCHTSMSVYTGDSIFLSFKIATIVE
uniref:Uncharacterized protein n=1 Tax=Utricularia reniformis TaxID=192314 RepID=A0A1Y0B2N6_9LAMI|nr:hypothetical protein AEK19_MT1469 [Utricularia reniformis]ART31660.1 hypothetical protein AEK19_MT1469 [Utricularia reniformis]